MKQKIIIENIKGLETDKTYVFQVDEKEVSRDNAFQLSKHLDKMHIKHIITFFPVKINEKTEAE